MSNAIQTGESMYTSGYYFPVCPYATGVSNNGGLGMVAGDAYAYHVWVPAGNTLGVTGIGILQADTVADNFRFRFGIYECGQDWIDTSLLVDAGTITKDAVTGTNTLRTVTFTEVTLGPLKRYVVVAMCEVAKSGAGLLFASFTQMLNYPVGQVDLGGSSSAFDVPTKWTGLATGSMPSSIGTLPNYVPATSSFRPPIVFWKINSYS